MSSATGPIFAHLLRNEDIRSRILSNLDNSSKCVLRLTSSECCEHVTRPLFMRTRLTFAPSSLTRPARLEALSRIGTYIESLTFYFPHSEETFLPPLLNPETGREINFLYNPHTTTQVLQHRPKYGSPELGDLLTQQYPPLFHAATNVPAFIKAFSHLTSLRHLTISCPGQDSTQRYRRDIVDYALISLRIAIERSPLHNLSRLTLHRIHPSGLQYLRHLPGWGSTPSASRRWSQVRKLKITMDSWDFGSTGMDHLKILDDYIRGFSRNLERLSFGWNGKRGPCPLTLFTDPLFTPPKSERGKLFCEVTSPMSPLPAAPRRKAMHLPKLKYMQVRNASMSSDQVSDFVEAHRVTVKEFDFENVWLINDGVWEDALAPLSRGEHEDAEWSSQQSGSELGSFSSSYASETDFDRFMREAISEVIDDIVSSDVPREVEPEQQSNSASRLMFGEFVARDSITVTKQKEKKHVRRRKRKHNHPKALSPAQSVLRISDPIPIPQPEPLSVPDRRSRPVSIPPLIVEESPLLLQPTTFLQPTIFKTEVGLPPIDANMDSQLDPNVQGVQRNLAQDLRREEISNDTEKRVSALKKAREAVLSKLSKEFVKSHNTGRNLLFKNTCSNGSTSMMGRSSSALVPLMFSR